MHHALELTEILLRIAIYLSDSELSVCTAACKSWSDLFLPLLYRTIALKWNSVIALETLEKQAHLVRDLRIDGDIPAQFYWVPYTCLTRLSLGYTYRNNRWDLCAQLISCQQHSLEHMALSMPCKVSKAVWKAIAGCSRLDSLSVECTYLDTEHFPYFWDACSQVTQLTLSYMNLSWTRFIPPIDRSSRDTDRYILGDNSHEHAEFDRLWQLDWSPLKVKHLALIINNSGMVLGQRRKGFQFRLLEKCPDLVSLEWRSLERNTFDLDLFAQAMASSPTKQKLFPHLARLSCSSAGVIGSQIASIVESLSAPLQLLHVYQPDDPANGRLLQSIHPHFSSLTSLDLRYARSIDRATVQTVLTSAPLLEELVADAVSVQDMIHGPPWVSTRLRRLDVFFDMGEMVEEEANGIASREEGSEEISSNASNASTPCQETLQSVILATNSPKRQEYTRHVFRQLSVLTSLVRLRINRNEQLRFREHRFLSQFMDFSLRGGLAMLGTLKFLENVRLPGEKCQSYGVEDVEWMLRAWPRLQQIQGELHPNPVVSDELKHMMERGGVLVVE